MELTEQQQRDVCLILSTGCDRLAAAKYVGCSLADLRRAIRNVPQFAADLRRAEAAIEMTHMRNVQNAAKDEKHWRASVWWLERRAPERYGRRDAGEITVPQLESFAAQLIAAVSEEVRDEGDRGRLLARLRRVAESVGQAPPEAEPPGWLGSTAGSPQERRGVASLHRSHPGDPAAADDAEDAERNEPDIDREP